MGLGLHETLTVSQHHVKVAVLDQEQPTRAQHGGKIDQSPAQALDAQHVGQRVAEAEHSIERTAQLLAQSKLSCQFAEASYQETGFDSSGSSVLPGPLDHGRAQVRADHLVATPRQLDGVPPRTAGDVQHAVGTYLAQGPLDERHFVGQAVLPVHETVVMVTEGVV